jgi:hypothetical protein
MPCEHVLLNYSKCTAERDQLRAELSRLRLMDEEHQALTYLRFFADELHKVDGMDRDHYATADRALAVLDRLLQGDGK